MAEDEIIKKHTKAVYTTMTDPNKKWLHKLKDILLEVLIIVFAVSVSIWFHGWAENRKDQKAEQEFFAGLKEDLKADAVEMMNDRAIFQQLLQHAGYFARVARGMAPNKDSIGAYQWIFFTVAQINPRISRFEALKGSGKLDIIEDKKVLINIIDLYQKNFPNIFRINQSFNTLTTDRIDPYIDDVLKMDSSGQLTNVAEILHASKMQLLLNQLGTSADNCVKAYTGGINKSNEILKQIGNE